MGVESGSLTFFVWADMHFGYQPEFGEKDIRWRTVQQMKTLDGWPYPPEVGGSVQDPSLILVCGDFVDSGSDGERNFAYYRNALGRINLPSYEAMGNHEAGYGNITDYFQNRYGGLYYSFDHKGVHFVALCQTFDATEKVEILAEHQIEWLHDDLAALDGRRPVVIFSHDDLDKQPDAEAIHAVLRNANVIVTFSGHTHGQRNRQCCSHDWNGIPVVNTGHVRDHPIDRTYGRFILVVRITRDQVAVVPWRWDLEEWARHQGDGIYEGSKHVLISRV